ncbi:MAG: hypothetical protein JW844_00190 [Candidatus Omnitrophica bacterium]|nr:hypothetical protein [Candidatus Omnitrophota bacterium]
MRIKVWLAIFLFTLFVTLCINGVLNHREKPAFARVSSETEEYRDKVIKKLDNIIASLDSIQKEQAAMREELSVIKVRASR